jgi:hypothetical protein
MNPALLPVTIEGKLLHVLEECSEVAKECAIIQKSICKAVRFGLENAPPGKTITNREKLLAELGDLRFVADRLRAALGEFDE